MIRVVAALLAGLVVGFLFIVRFKPRPMLRGIRTLNKQMLNPAMLRLAGTRFWYAATLEHTGRRSGQHYRIPVVAEPTDGGFVIPLPYGTDVDWLKNVRASGTCEIRYRGEEYTCGEPVVLRIDEAANLVQPSRRRVWRILGINEVLSVKQVAKKPSQETPTG